MPMVTVYITEPVMEWLNEKAVKTGRTANKIVQDIVYREYMKEKNRE